MKNLIPLFCSLTIIVLAACVGPATTVKTGPGTAYPCGVYGHSCGNHMCCSNRDDCGFDGPFSNCPAGYCCFAGTDTGSKKSGAPRKQWSEDATP